MDVDVLVLYLQEGQTGQFALKDAPAGLTYKTYSSSSFTSITTNGTQSVLYTQGVGQADVGQVWRRAVDLSARPAYSRAILGSTNHFEP
jgi:hypothetical protein